MAPQKRRGYPEGLFFEIVNTGKSASLRVRFFWAKSPVWALHEGGFRIPQLFLSPAGPQWNFLNLKTVLNWEPVLHREQRLLRRRDLETRLGEGGSLYTVNPFTTYPRTLREPYSDMKCYTRR